MYNPMDYVDQAGLGSAATVRDAILVEIGKYAKSVIDSYKLTCKPAGQSDAQYTAAQITLCIGQAMSAVEAQFGRAMSAAQVVSGQGHCNAQIALEQATTGVKSC